MDGPDNIFRQSICVIIPVLNEEGQIASTLAGLETAANKGGVEINIVDGGSVDRTVAVAGGFDRVEIIESDQANRGRQMNAGARHAKAETLLFLHADARLPQDAFETIESTLKDNRICGGCFQIRFPSEAPRSLHLVAWGINLRTRLFKTATGDQGIFIRRSAFEKIGGYQNIPLMEDIALFNEMKRRGRVKILDEKIEISPRRWLKHGVWRTVLLMYALRFGYWLGVSPAELKRYFVDVR